MVSVSSEIMAGRAHCGQLQLVGNLCNDYFQSMQRAAAAEKPSIVAKIPHQGNISAAACINRAETGAAVFLPQ